MNFLCCHSLFYNFKSLQSIFLETQSSFGTCHFTVTTAACYEGKMPIRNCFLHPFSPQVSVTVVGHHPFTWRMLPRSPSLKTSLKLTSSRSSNHCVSSLRTTIVHTTRGVENSSTQKQSLEMDSLIQVTIQAPLTNVPSSVLKMFLHALAAAYMISQLVNPKGWTRGALIV